MNKVNYPVKMVVLDLAGTTVDFGSQAPLRIFEKTFQEFGLEFSEEEIAEPMGMEKRDHIRTMLSTEKGRELFQNRWRRSFGESDVEAIYKRFESNLKSVVTEYSHVIEGVPEAIRKIQKKGICVGCTTGYTSDMTLPVLIQAKREGFNPDFCVTPDICESSRPEPFMIFELMRRAKVFPPQSVVKVGDTRIDMEEGKNAGAFAVGVLKGSSLMGFSKKAFDAATVEELQTAKSHATEKFLEAGADFVLDSISELPDLVEKISSGEAFK